MAGSSTGGDDCDRAGHSRHPLSFHSASCLAVGAEEAADTVRVGGAAGEPQPLRVGCLFACWPFLPFVTFCQLLQRPCGIPLAEPWCESRRAAAFCMRSKWRSRDRCFRSFRCHEGSGDGAVETARDSPTGLPIDSPVINQIPGAPGRKWCCCEAIANREDKMLTLWFDP